MPEAVKSGDMEAPVIFVVDDNTDAGELASLLLVSYGWQVRSFGDARSCVEAALRQPPACILSDLNMPVMDGLQLMDALAGAGLRVPVVITTASPADSAPARRAVRRAAGMIGKPYEGDRLHELLARAVAQAPEAMPLPLRLAS